MSQPTPPAPESEPEEPAKSKKPPGGASFWYLILAMVVLVGVLTIFGPGSGGEKVGYSQFLKGLEDGTYTSRNVHQLVISEAEVTFRNRPLETDDVLGQTPDPDAPKNYDPDAPLKTFFVPMVSATEKARDELREKLRENGIEESFARRPMDWSNVGTLVFILLTLLLIWLLFKRLGGAGSALSFGRSRARLASEDDVQVTFDQVAGQEESVEELREVVEFLKTPGKYQALGGRIPRGVLLVGPPGTGKTLLAKAVAGEAGVPFFSLSGSDFVEMFVGVGAARVRDMFSQAVAKSPSIIFIDELDALGKVRGSGMPGGHDEREQTLNALLVEMDGFSTDESVIVMAATNRPETLDPALLRPGRFDRNVLVDRPDVKGREAILKVHAAKAKLDEDVDITRLAKLTPGFVGADLANLVNEAALLAARADKKAVGMAEFEEGVERVVAGLEKTSRIIQEDEKLRVAYHECGHALVATALPHTDPVVKISIIPRGFGALGYMRQSPSDDRYLASETELRHRIAVCFGGIAAEELIFNETSTGPANDLEQATGLARRMVCEFGMSPRLGRIAYETSGRSPFLAGGQSGGSDTLHAQETLREIDQEVKRVIDECMQLARDVLRERRDVLEHMTRDLLEVEVMDPEQLHKILDQYKTGPSLTPGTAATRDAAPNQPADAAATAAS